MKRRGKRGPNPVNSLQLSLFDALIAVDAALVAIEEHYRGQRVPVAVFAAYQKLRAERERIRNVNAVIARISLAA